jgi:hypothetical protein
MGELVGHLDDFYHEYPKPGHRVQLLPWSACRALPVSTVTTFLVALISPAAAIVGAALLQVALQIVWPGVQQVTIRGITLDSYVAVGALLLLSVLTGAWLRWRTANRFALAAALLVPVGWLIALLPHSRLAFNLDALMWLAAAISPLLGVVIGAMWGARLGVWRH